MRGGPYRMSGIQPASSMCKASALPDVLSLRFLVCFVLRSVLRVQSQWCLGICVVPGIRSSLQCTGQGCANLELPPCLPQICVMGPLLLQETRALRPIIHLGRGTLGGRRRLSCGSVSEGKLVRPQEPGVWGPETRRGGSEGQRATATVGVIG